MEIKLKMHIICIRKQKWFLCRSSKEVQNELLYICVLNYRNAKSYSSMRWIHHGTGSTPISFFNSSNKSWYSACSRTKTVTVPRLTPIAAPNSWRLGTYAYGIPFSSQTAGKWHMISIGDTSPANNTILTEEREKLWVQAIGWNAKQTKQQKIIKRHTQFHLSSCGSVRPSIHFVGTSFAWMLKFNDNSIRFMSEN